MRRSIRYAYRLLFTSVLVTAAFVTAGSATASAATPPDPAPCVVLVHDLARDATSWTTAVDLLHREGRCALAVTWGSPQGPDVPLPVAGLRGADAGADDLAAALDRAGDGPHDVIAHGAGSLVVQRYLQQYGTTQVRSLTTLGPIWNGTRIAGLADTEDLSRRLGTYDLVLTWEKPLVDPVCAGCRELIAGSDLLRELHGAGIPTAPVRYTDIASPCDELSPAQQLPGSRLVLLDHCASHFALPDDPAALDAAVAAALGR